MNLAQDALHVLQTVAPTIAKATLGPFGGLAATALSAILGTPPADEQATSAALLNATPDQLLALKKAEQDFQVQIKTLGISEEKLVYDDIANARARQIAVKDDTPAILAYAITFGFFGTLGFMLWNGKPAVGGDALLVMLGSLGTAWAGVVSFYFGSSLGSAKKDTALAAAAATR
jgi:hypothetical protein